MHGALLFLHSIFRWLVLASLAYSIYRAYRGFEMQRAFTKKDNAIRHWTATIAHMQLMIGMVLYFKSPLIKYFWSQAGSASQSRELNFFSVVHAALMLISIVIITIGSALARRQQQDKAAFKTILLWYSIAMILIFIAIPWPFSPLTSRPYFR